MGEKKTISNWVKYTKRGGGIINPVGDYDIGNYLGSDIAKEDLEEAEKIIDPCETYLAKIYKVSKDYWKE